MPKRRKYNPEQVQAVVNLKKAFPKMSVRKIADVVDIPKTQINNWIREPDVWKEKYRFNVPDSMDRRTKKYKQLMKFKKKVHDAKQEDPNKYKGLYIRYDEGDWEAYSG